MTTFRELLERDPIELGEVAARLDALGNQRRIAELRSVPGRLQGRLFAAARGFRALDAEHFVPPDRPDRAFVRHFGKNSLPLFTHFEKRFARPAPGAPVHWGYNHGPLMGIIGPGHFVLRRGPGAGEMHVDYYSLPAERLEGAPRLQANTAGLSLLVYGNMIDVLRGVSRHVSIGRALKYGRETGNYFLLCREDP